MGKNAEKNAITYVEICKIYDYIQICANLCKNKYSKFWKCHCSKICDMRFFAKYALAYAITCSHITGIPNHSPERGTWLRPKYGALQALQIAAKPLQIVTLATHCGQRYRFPKIRVPPPNKNARCLTVRSAIQMRPLGLYSTNSFGHSIWLIDWVVFYVPANTV